METVISVKNLVKRYGNLTAVNSISFEVHKGEIFGLLGHDVSHESANAKRRIGVQLQSSSYYHYLTLEEILKLFGSFYGLTVNAKELLQMVDLEHKAKAYVTQLSGGQRQRFSIVASLVNNPDIVFLDEPTTGLDPIARRNLWGIISKIREQGKTVVLTTHYMEEAELLCDRIAIMEKGNIIALDKTTRLIEKAKYPYAITFEPTKNEDAVVKKLGEHGTIERQMGKAHLYEMHLPTSTKLAEMIDLVQSTAPEGLTVRPASLEDLFIELTGKTINAEEEHVA